ncbi:MAG: VWA domain-containing protein, partial [Campylobacterota bacterium]|nr:VWA domain-containing protein [Campylobacterota bacterium]
MRRFLLSFIVVFMTLSTGLYAEDNPRAVIIFDASGSMWGQINGVTKIEIARDTLKNVVKEWNPDVELGLTIYGHRSKGDCDDIETVIPVGKIDQNRVISTVMEIKPKGKTPISRSLKRVAEEIKYTEERATIILISDGKETCDPDPCGTAKALERDGIDFVVHVVGFNVDKSTDRELECIAAATGGEYFSAKSAAALNSAMKVIAKKVEVAKPEPKPKPVAKELKNNLEATASEKEGGKWIKAYHRIYRAENGQKSDKQLTSVNSTKKDAGITKLPTGHYILQSEYNKFKKLTPFEIKAGEVAKVHAVMGETGTVEIIASETKGGEWIKAGNYILYDDDGKPGKPVTSAHSSKKEAGVARIPAGKYIVRSNYNKFKKLTPFEIKPGEVTKVNIVFGETGTVEIIASETKGGEWIKAGNYISQDDDGKLGRSVTSAHSSKKEAGVARIPAGKYIVRSNYNKFKKLTPFEIKPG